jgi:hypothetical protein
MLRYATRATARINKGFRKRFDALRGPGGAPSAQWEADYPSCR